MKETFRNCRPAFLYDVAAMETWLEDWDRKGYQLADFKGMNGIFVRTEPQECRYRLSPLPKKEKLPDMAQMELYGAMGWDYAATIANTFHVWRCGDPAAPELDADPVVQETGYRYLKGRMVREVLWCLLALVIVLLMGSWGYHLSPVPLLELIRDKAPGIVTFYALCLLLVLAAEAVEVGIMVRLLRCLRAGAPVERPRPYRWKQRLTAAVTVLCFAPVFIGAVNGIFGGPWALADLDGAVYVDLAELEPATVAVRVQGSEFKRHELAPRQDFITQSAELPDGTQSWAHSACYQLLTPKLVPALERDLRFWNRAFEDTDDLTAVEAPGLDVLWWSETEAGQFILAIRGRNVLTLLYEGPTDLRTAGDYFARLLERVR